MAMQDKVANAVKVMKGKAKEAAGKITANPRLKVEGRLEQGIGNIRQAGQKLKDSGKNVFGR